MFGSSPWLDAAQAARWRASGVWSGLTLADHARRMAAEEPDRIVLIDGEVELRIGPLTTMAARLAGALLDRGLKPGDVISVQLPNWWEGGVITLAAAMAGLVLNPIVPIYRQAELRHILADSRSRLIFIPSTFRRVDYAAMLGEVAAALDPPPELVLVRGEQAGLATFADLVAAGDPATPPPAVAADAPALLLYTSGTTGPAKGVVHSHETVGVMASDQEAQWGPWRDVAILVPSPVTHITGALQAFFQPLALGARAVLMESWDPVAAMALINRHDCRSICAAPPFIAGLLDEAARTGETLPRFRLMGSGGAGVAPSLIDQCYERFPSLVATRLYGCTEVPSITSGVRSRADRRHGAETDGMIELTAVRLVAPGTETEVAQGEEGEVIARGAQMMLRYLRDEDNVGAFTSDGWFRTGDLGRVVDGRYLLITGRAKDLIIRKGENLSPKEIEDALHSHPAVAAAAVIGVPDPERGEAVCAFVVLKPAQSLEMPEVRSFIAKVGLAPQKTPERLEFVDELPMSPQGKVRKDLLKALAKERLAAAEAG